MKISHPLIKVAFTIAVIATGCSILKKEDPEKEIRLFVQEFKESLDGSDQLILNHFSTQQSKEAILSAIKVLQNKDMQYMECISHFDGSIISMTDEGIQVTIPVEFKTVDLDEENSKSSELTMWLIKNEGKFTISKLGGEVLYNDYIQFQNNISWSVNRKTEEAERAIYFAKAAELQQKYDSVIMYVNYNGATYYYVVNGNWWNYFTEYKYDEKPTDYKMGLVDENGKEIIPVEYELIGTPGILKENVVEVKKDGKVGYFEMNGDILVPAEYDWIIPYEHGLAMALVKKDTVEGWINRAAVFEAGYPDEEATAFMKHFEFLPTEFTLSNENQAMAEIPHGEYIGYGIVIPPAHWVRFDLFHEIMGGFVMNDIENRSDIEYIKTENSFIENAFDNFSAVITTFTRRYLYGREEFYTNNQLTIVAGDKMLASKEFNGLGKTSFKKIDSTLLEIKVEPLNENLEYFDDSEEIGIPQYSYFAMTKNGQFELLESQRRFPFTQFAKIDSSYLSGAFRLYNTETGELDNTDFLSHETLSNMRNEILAEYGFVFPDPSMADRFKYAKWYVPRYKTYGDIVGGFKEIDAHNIAFLEAMIGTLDPGSTAM